jgi:hypothetical protein
VVLKYHLAKVELHFPEFSSLYDFWVGVDHQLQGSLEPYTEFQSINLGFASQILNSTYGERHQLLALSGLEMMRNEGPFVSTGSNLSFLFLASCSAFLLNCTLLTDSNWFQIHHQLSVNVFPSSFSCKINPLCRVIHSGPESFELLHLFKE